MIETLIVDGYNIIHAVPELETALDKSLKSARETLEKVLRRYQAYEKSIKRIYVIYDSKGCSEKEMEDLGLIKNIYTPSSSDADREIVSILKNADKPERIAVLSKDNFVINHGRAMGANIISLDIFIKKLNREQRLTTEKQEISEEQKAQITNELKRLWGLD